MTWVRLDDGFAEHPKVLKAGPRAAWLFIRCLCYSARHLTDGHIPAPFLDGWRREVKALSGAGLIEQGDNGYRIHDYLSYNPSRSSVLRSREQAAERMRNVRGNSGRSSPNPVPQPLPEVPVQNLPPVAAAFEPNGKGSDEEWLNIRGASGMENALLRKLKGIDPKWGQLTPAGLNRLRGRFGDGVVTTALQHVYENRTVIERGPYPLLLVTCQHLSGPVGGG